MVSRNSPAFLPTMALLAAVGLWSSSFVGMKIALREVAPLTIIWMRLVCASIVVLPMLRRGMGANRKPGDWKWLLVVALFQPCLYFTLESYALQYTSASEAGTISATMPLMVAALAALFLGEKASVTMLAGLLLSCGGVAWLTLAGTPSPDGPNPALGNALECGAMVAAAGYTLALRKLEGRYGPWALTGLQSLAGFLWFLPGALFSGFPEFSDISAIWPSLLAVVYMGVFVSLGAFWCYNYALAYIPAGRASAFINMIPVLCLILGWAVLDERLNTLQYAACVVVLAGVCLSQELVPWKRSRQRARVA
ncbi:MAG: DMT family transporter [Halodesulfovibrio sp.]